MTQCCFIYSPTTSPRPHPPASPPSLPSDFSPALAPDRPSSAHTIPAPTAKSDGHPTRAMFSPVSCVRVGVGGREWTGRRYW